ncbi:MAG: S-layer homology domain-containing protein [Halanaerobium sp.]
MNFSKILLITLILVFAVTAFAAAEEFDDVPRDHWAYDSVQTLAEKGYLSLYAGEDFDGDESVTRYEMAEIIANMLENMSADEQNLSDEDVGVIRELSLEFRDELVAVAQKQKDFEERIKKAEDANQIQNEDISDINARVSELQEEVTEIADNINNLAELEEEVADIENRIADLEEDTGGKNIQDLEDAQSVNMTKIEDLEDRIAELESQMGSDDAELLSGGDSMRTAYIIGGLALLALLL